MLRWFQHLGVSVSFSILALGGGSLLWGEAQEALAKAPRYPLRAYAPKVGDTYRVKLEQSQLMLIGDQKATTLQRREERQDIHYVEQVLKVEGGEIHLRERVYQRCVISQRVALGAQTRSMPWGCGLVGRRIRIQGSQGVEASFQILDQAPVSKRDRIFLRRSLSRQTRDGLFPKDPIAVGETWVIPPAQILGQLPIPHTAIDQKKLRALGTFVRLENAPEGQLATLKMDVDVPLLSFPRFHSAVGRIILHSQGIGAVDGRSSWLDNKAKTRIVLEGKIATRRGLKHTRMVLESQHHRKVLPLPPHSPLPITPPASQPAPTSPASQPAPTSPASSPKPASATPSVVPPKR